MSPRLENSPSDLPLFEDPVCNETTPLLPRYDEVDFLPRYEDVVENNMEEPDFFLPDGRILVTLNKIHLHPAYIRAYIIYLKRYENAFFRSYYILEAYTAFICAIVPLDTMIPPIPVTCTHLLIELLNVLVRMYLSTKLFHKKSDSFFKWIPNLFDLLMNGKILSRHVIQAHQHAKDTVDLLLDRVPWIFKGVPAKTYFASKGISDSSLKRTFISEPDIHENVQIILRMQAYSAIYLKIPMINNAHVPFFFLYFFDAVERQLQAKEQKKNSGLLRRFRTLFT